MAKKKVQTLEQKIDRIRAILEKMQAPDTSFDENIQLFKEGSTLLKESKAYLEESEMLIRELVEKES